MQNSQLLAHHLNVFKCPICSTPMYLSQTKSLICQKQHCFDLAGTGYVNFLLRPHQTKYDKKLFRHRRIIFQSGFFAPLVQQIGRMINTHRSSAHSLKILDTGCGEGSFLAALLGQINQNGNAHCLGVGLDIAKEGIAIAAKNHQQCIWCVADLAKSPLVKHQFDFITNILSPSNYAEFKRMLKDQGLLIKVVPGPKHLLELRELFFEQRAEGASSGLETTHLFAHHFRVQNQQVLTYKFRPELVLLESLVEMTPLSWRAPEGRLQKVIDEGLTEVTVDLMILSGERKGTTVTKKI